MNNNEIWKEIKYTKGNYAISNQGRLKRITNANRYKSGKILQPCIDKTGYVRQVLCFDGKRVSKNIHTLVCHEFIGPRQNNMCVNHKNGIRHDNRLDNLEYITYSQNTLDGINRTGNGRGEMHNRCKLSDEIIQKIRKCEWKKGMDRILGKKYGVHRDTIRLIKDRKTWKHI